MAVSTKFYYKCFKNIVKDKRENNTNNDGMKVFHDQFRPIALAYLRNNFRKVSQADYEDILQCMFLGVYQHEFDDNIEEQIRNPNAWLKTVLRNCALKQLAYNTISDSTQIEDIIDTSDVELSIIEIDCMETILNRLKQSNIKDYELMIQLVIGNKTIDEIAHKIGLKYGAFLTKICRIRKKLNKLMELLC